MASTSHQSEIPYAFDEIAPPSICASAKSSTTLEKPACRVFINHRGPDVKETLARAIYHALHVKGLGVFLDSKELELGDFLPEALQKAMSSASLHVAIFSPTYAQSPWCLAELSFMLQTGAPIIPIFYGVQPTDLRWVAQGNGLYAGSFSEHQAKGRYSLEKLQEWKMSLHTVSFYMGEIINNNDEEQMKLKNIVNRVLKEMKVVQLTAVKHPVGLEAVVADIETPACESAKNHPFIWLTPYILSFLLLLFSNQEKFQSGGMIFNSANDGVHKFPGVLLNTRRPLLLGLKVLVVKGNYWYNLSIVEFSIKSEWPSFTGIADGNLPLTMENLRVLELNQSGLEDFRNREPQAPEPLRMLIISFCPNFRINPESIQYLMYIAQLTLNRSANVNSLLDDFHCLQSPDHLQLKSCEILSPVTSCFGHLRNLRHPNLTHSGKQRMLSDYFKQFNLLQHLNLSWWHPDASLSRLPPGKLAITLDNSQLTLAFRYGYEYALDRQIEAGARRIPLTQLVHTPPTQPWIRRALMGTIVTVVMVDDQGRYLHEGLKHYIKAWTFDSTWITRAPSMNQAEEELLGIVSAPRTQTKGESVTTIKSDKSNNVAKEHAQTMPTTEGSILMLPLWVVTEPRWQIRDLASIGEWWNFNGWFSAQLVHIVDLEQKIRGNYQLVEGEGQHLETFEPLVRQPATYEEKQIEAQITQDQLSVVIVVRFRVQIEREDALFEVHIISQEREHWFKNTTVASREQDQSHQGETVMTDEIQRLRTEILELRAERERMQAEVQKLQEEVVRLRAGLATA